TACEASSGVGAGSLTKMVGAAHAPPPGLPASGGRSGWRAVGAGPLRASGAVWGASESRGGFAAAGAPSPLPPLAGGGWEGGRRTAAALQFSDEEVRLPLRTAAGADRAGAAARALWQPDAGASARPGAAGGCAHSP